MSDEEDEGGFAVNVDTYWCQNDECGQYWWKPSGEPDHTKGVPHVDGLKCPWCGSISLPQEEF